MVDENHTVSYVLYTGHSQTLEAVLHRLVTFRLLLLIVVLILAEEVRDDAVSRRVHLNSSPNRSEITRFKPRTN